MKSSSPGRIYLSDQRGHVETSRIRRFCTFNFEDFINEHRIPVHNLCLLNDDMLAGGQTTSMQIEKASYIIIVPVTGEIKITDSSGLPSMLNVGELRVLNVPAESTIHIANSYSTELVNYLVIGILCAQNLEHPISTFFEFDLDKQTDRFVEIVSTQVYGNEIADFKISIGRFAGRNEAVYKPLHKEAVFFAFVIGGAFEIEGRLLHERDGLALCEVDEIEVEALSNDAVVLVIEC